jgi:hypothetical protein
MLDNQKDLTEPELAEILGDAKVVWLGIMAAAEQACGPFDRTWKPAKIGVGRMCLLQRKQRTLLYMIPDRAKVWIAIVLGERAYGLAMASSLPASLKKMFAEAKPYVEGRGIRFSTNSLDDIPTVVQLLELKTAPK